MKILAIDYGTKQIGIAISNAAGTIAFPHSVIEHNHLLFKTLRKLIYTENVEKIIVGKPEYNKKTMFYKSVEKFICELNGLLRIPVESIDELLTSESARNTSLQTQKITRRRKTTAAAANKQKNRHDLAAVCILENYITRTGTV